MGSDEIFAQDVETHQDLLIANGMENTSMFQTAEDQKLFMPILKDNIMNIFDSPEEQQILNKAMLGMKSNFKDVLDGSKQTMSLFPEAFDYDSRVKLHNTVVLEQIQEFKKTRSDFGEIQKAIKIIKPQASEADVFHGLVKFFHRNRGVFLHSLKLDQYLKIFVDLTKIVFLRLSDR